MITRLLEKRILHLAKHFPAIAILGPRQVGKTTLAKILQKKLPKECEYLDLENPIDYLKLSNALQYFKLNQNKCIIVDEVQRMPELFPLLRSMIDSNRVPCRFLLLGSASPDLLKQSSETLAGRIVYTELTPFNFFEIKNRVPLISHWMSGGFPDPFLLKDKILKTEWFSSFIMTYIERDLPLLGLKTSSKNVSRLISMIAHSHGQLLNKSTFSKSLETSVPTIRNYLDYLENAFLIRRLYPFYINIKKRLVKTPKIYLRDSGLLHHILRIDDFDVLSGHPVIGHSWEGYIIEQIISICGNKFEYSFYRTQDGSECDLVLSKSNAPLACIEVKYTSVIKKTRSLSTSMHDLKTEHNFLIIPEDTDPFPLSTNITVCNLEYCIFELEKL